MCGWRRVWYSITAVRVDSTLPKGNLFEQASCVCDTLFRIITKSKISPSTCDYVLCNKFFLPHNYFRLFHTFVWSVCEENWWMYSSSIWSNRNAFCKGHWSFFSLVLYRFGLFLAFWATILRSFLFVINFVQLLIVNYLMSLSTWSFHRDTMNVKKQAATLIIDKFFVFFSFVVHLWFQFLALCSIWSGLAPFLHTIFWTNPDSESTAIMVLNHPAVFTALTETLDPLETSCFSVRYFHKQPSKFHEFSEFPTFHQSLT